MNWRRKEFDADTIRCEVFTICASELSGHCCFVGNELGKTITGDDWIVFVFNLVRDIMTILFQKIECTMLNSCGLIDVAGNRQSLRSDQFIWIREVWSWRQTYFQFLDWIFIIWLDSEKIGEIAVIYVAIVWRWVFDLNTNTLEMEIHTCFAQRISLLWQFVTAPCGVLTFAVLLPKKLRNLLHMRTSLLVSCSLGLRNTEGLGVLECCSCYCSRCNRCLLGSKRERQ